VCVCAFDWVTAARLDLRLMPAPVVLCDGIGVVTGVHD
jgi:hypothetical protein